MIPKFGMMYHSWKKLLNRSRSNVPPLIKALMSDREETLSYE